MSKKKPIPVEEKLNTFRSKLLEDQKKFQENPTIEISETSLNRMNGPIGVELSKKELNAMKTDTINKKLSRR